MLSAMVLAPLSNSREGILFVKIFLAVMNFAEKALKGLKLIVF